MQRSSLGLHRLVHLQGSIAIVRMLIKPCKPTVLTPNTYNICCTKTTIHFEVCTGHKAAIVRGKEECALSLLNWFTYRLYRHLVSFPTRQNADSRTLTESSHRNMNQTSVLLLWCIEEVHQKRSADRAGA